MTSPTASAKNIHVAGRDKGRRTLIVAGLAHALHDGYTDTIFVLLPVWQAEFGLGYGVVAMLRTVFSGAMAGFQVPAGSLANRMGGRLVLVLGTALTAMGYLLAGFSGSLPGLCIALAAAGAGSSTQHPISSAAVARAYGAKARGPLGIYNFSGDLGKAAFPATASLLLMRLPWRGMLGLMAAFGLATAVAIGLFMPTTHPPLKAQAPEPVRQGGGRGGFPLLLAIGIIDTSVRAGLLTFLPFLLKAKGAVLPTVGLGLSLVFLGGAGGKFTCGWLGGRLGVLWMVVLTEGGTAAAILLLLALPLTPALAVLPLLGIMLNGTSSVLYGTVPELTAADQGERSFALFYTGALGAGAVSPVLYGLLGDAVGLTWATAATAITALATLPLTMALAPHLAKDRGQLT
jgi:MFS family permease